MTLLDWSIVLILNGSVIVYGLYLARGTETSGEWFLAARALPWWAVGMSMFATNVDSADLVSVTGKTYTEGLHILTVYAIGSALGGIVAGFWVVPAISRQGYYTNAEYLEGRFGPATRALSVLIQLQYRSTMLGLMIWSMFLLLTQLVDLSPAAAWTLILAAVVLAGLYTAWGGLKSVVWTDLYQGLIMLIGSAVVLVAVWNAVGGWSGMNAALAAAGTVNGQTLADLPHIGRYRGDSGAISPYIVALGWTIIGCGYWTVNHTQTMRLMGCRSLWDMKMAAVFGVGISLPVMLGCTFLGLFARALPEFQHVTEPDTLYPLLANRYLASGLKGFVVAGVVAAVVSTFDSMGSALSALFTRDIYARLLVRGREDAHYVFVGRVATVGVLLLGFAYLPFIQQKKNMLDAFTTLVSVFVTPLLTVYLAGVLTRAHRRSGAIGLAVGSLYGAVALWNREFAEADWLPQALAGTWLPEWFTGRWVAFSWSMLFTAATMLLVTLVLGRSTSVGAAEFHESGWLDRSREVLPQMPDHPFAGGIPVWCRPCLWAGLLMLGCCWLIFVTFW